MASAEKDKWEKCKRNKEKYIQLVIVWAPRSF